MAESTEREQIQACRAGDRDAYRRAQLSGLAAADAVSYVMPASADLAAGNRVIGCAGPVSEAGAIAEYANVGRGWL